MARLFICVALLVFTARVYGEDKANVSPSPTLSSNTSTPVSPTTTTTTSSSSSTSAKSPTFTPLPTSAPNQTYIIPNETSHGACVKMSGGIQMIVGYNLTGGVSVLAPVAVLNTTTYNGSCGSPIANITLEGRYPPDNSALYNITFIMMATKDQWNVSDIVVEINLKNSVIFKNATDAIPKPKSELMANNPNPTLFPAVSLKSSYKCNSTMAYEMTVENGANDTYNLTLNLAQFQLQAFNFTPANETQFGKAQQCPADIKGSKIVPIAVGAALAGLVIIVIVAYIVGRLRSRKQNSYEALS